MADELSLVSILQVAGIGGVVAAVANQSLKWGLDTFTERGKKRSDTTYAAVRLAVIFERYVLLCEGHLRDCDVTNALGGPSKAGKLPVLDAFPSDINWRAVETSLAMAALGFPSLVEEAQAECYRADWESDDYWVSEVKAVELGLEAWELSELIRRRHKLGTNEQLASTVAHLKKVAEKQALARAGLRAQYESNVDQATLAAEAEKRGW